MSTPNPVPAAAASASLTLQPGVSQTLMITIGSVSINVTLQAVEATTAEFVLLPSGQSGNLPSGQGALTP